jgi:hypothetical protein
LSVVAVTISTKVLSGGAAIGGAAVSVEIRDPSGAVTMLAATSGSNGIASVGFGMKKSVSPVGTYTVTSRATMGSLTSTATTSFVLK